MSDDAFTVRIAAVECAYQVERSRLDPRAHDAGTGAAAFLCDDFDATDPRAAIQYYLNYTEYAGRVSPIELASFTHVDEAQPDVKKRYFEVARKVDAAVCMAERYAAELRAMGIA